MEKNQLQLLEIKNMLVYKKTFKMGSILSFTPLMRELMGSEILRVLKIHRGLIEDSSVYIIRITEKEDAKVGGELLFEDTKVENF